MGVDIADMRWHLRWAIGCAPVPILLYIDSDQGLPRALSQEAAEEIAENLSLQARRRFSLAGEPPAFVTSIFVKDVRAAYQKFKKAVERP